MNKKVEDSKTYRIEHDEHTDYRHIWLYAKGYYPATRDIHTDLKIIMAHRAGVDVEYINDQLVLETLIEIVLNNTTNIYRLREWIIEMIKPLVGLPSMYTVHSDVDLEFSLDRFLVALRRCLSTLSTTKMNETTDDGLVKLISIGEIDKDIVTLLKAPR